MVCLPSSKKKRVQEIPTTSKTNTEQQRKQTCFGKRTEGEEEREEQNEIV